MGERLYHRDIETQRKAGKCIFLTKIAENFNGYDFGFKTKNKRY
jgi:hypothetical protein